MRILGVLLVVGLVGCGGTAPSMQTSGPESGELAVQQVVGGAIVGSCVDVSNHTLTVRRAHTSERWKLIAGAQPEPVAAPDPAQCPAGSTAGDTLGDRRFEKTSEGWQVVGPSGPVLVRKGPTRLSAAAYDGTALWTLGARNIWRWIPGKGAPLGVALPAELHDEPAQSAFFEGPVLWVRTAPDQGHPLNVDGAVATYVKPASGLGPIATGPITLPISDVMVTLELGSADAKVGDLAWTIAPPSAVLPWGGGLLLADANALTWWSISDSGAKRLSEVKLGSATLALFDEGDQVLAVGADYGLIAIGLTRPTAPPATPVPAR